VYRGSADDIRDASFIFRSRRSWRRRQESTSLGQTGLFLIEVDADALGTHCGGSRRAATNCFPHLYGELDLRRSQPTCWILRTRSDGSHDIPELAP